MGTPDYARQRIINLGKFKGILGKSDEKLFIRFHLLAQVRNVIPLISPVATVKTGEKKWTGILRETWIPFHFPFPLTSTVL